MDLLTHWLAPAVLAAAGAVVALLFDAFDDRQAAAFSVIVGSLAAAAAATASAFGLAPVGSSSTALSPVLGIVIAVLALLGAAAVAGGWRTVTVSDHGGRVTVLAGLSISSAALAIGAPDLIVLFAALEGMALSAYGLVALGGTDRSREAAMKYFVQGAVATGLLLIGLAVFFAGTGGDLAYGTMLTVGATLPRGALLLAWTFLMSALAFKAGAFPFHAWAPDAYETAPAPAAGLLASVGKGAAISVLALLAGARVAQTSMQGESTATAVLAVIAAGSIVFGNFAALRQHSLRRMLAYSGIAQVGYALIGIVTGRPLTAVVLVLVYAPAALAAFLIAETVAWERPEWNGTIGGLAGLAKRRPAVAAALAAIMLSLTGVPLFAGFWGKLAVFASTAGTPWLWLAVLGAVGSVVSFGYYGAVLRACYMADEHGEAESAHPAGPGGIVACLLALAVLAVGVAPLVVGTQVVGLVFGG